MKKIVLWVLSTVTVLVLLLGYRTSTDPDALSTSTSVVQAATGTTSGSTSSPGSTGSTTGDRAGGSTGSGSTDTSNGSGSSNGSGGSSGSVSTTASGDVVQTRWGPLQVEITVKNGEITAVDVPVYPDDNGKDRQINGYALPVLVQETLDAQSASIDMVSGATVTSTGYTQSLQSALDQAGL
ncbi:FMN-binding protein [Isoptericola sp. 178]|uniref:FMN-binding protein n=1 Tax=Isoptericola sp. 178 TaxID=3064651 RepID=UPI00271283E9|nr:FMN-binding protein [Isoptericola sp. 178]MDO8144384.1 FMN-binding protein [Isoptericola sp. 178]